MVPWKSTFEEVSSVAFAYRLSCNHDLIEASLGDDS